MALEGYNADAGVPGVLPGSRDPQRIECPQLRERIAYPRLHTIETLDRLAIQDPKTHATVFSNNNVAIPLEDVSDKMGPLADANPEADLLQQDFDIYTELIGMYSKRHLYFATERHACRYRYPVGGSCTNGWTVAGGTP